MQDNQFTPASSVPDTSTSSNMPSRGNDGVTPMQHGPTHKMPMGKMLPMLLVTLLVAAAAGGGAYWYRDMKAKKDLKAKDAQIMELEHHKTELQAELDAEKAKTAKTTTTTTPAKVAPTAAQLDNMKAAISSKNTAALEGYMAASVHVVIAASGGVLDHTPAQAIKDVDYVSAGTNPWNFSLPAATLTAYRAGSYKDYFPSDALVGKSANNYLISFTFNDAGKISVIFMAKDANSL